MNEKPEWTSIEIMRLLASGDGQAADAVFTRYMERLTQLARVRLSPRLAARTDPEDIVLSAWRSFFVGASDGRFSLVRSGDLWRLLVSITMHKLYHHVRHHQADRRAVQQEERLDSLAEESLRVGRAEPSPEEAVALADELESIMSQLDPFERRVLELRLRGEPFAVIADATGRAERTVRRVIGQIRKRLADQTDPGDEQHA